MAAQRRRVPLGAGITLAGARTAARVILGQIASGQDPAAARKMQAAATRAQVERDRLTLARLLETWHERHLSSRRPRYAKEAVRALERAFGSALGRPAADLDRAAVVRVLDTLPPAMAVRSQAYGRAAFEWARRREMVPLNPFADLPAGHRIAARDRVLSDPELAAIWHAAAAEQLPSRPLVQLLILTAQRREEVAALPWAELSDDLSTWVLPAARAKNRVQHLVLVARRLW